MIIGDPNQTEEEFSSGGYSANRPAGVEGRYRHYHITKDPDTISQTSFRSINEKDYGRVQDTQENERLLFQVNLLLLLK